MKVILKADVKGQGKKGQLVEVSDGYARNYLLPRKLAVEANAQNLNEMKEREAALAHKRSLEIAAANEIKEKLEKITVEVGAKGAVDGGRLFGSITTKEIADSLKEQHGIEVDRRKIVLNESIKTSGRYEVPVKLYPDITGTINIEVKVITA